ncbi:MAG TPA: HYR domain-containing protein [Candidatus Eisenbacteria bacterium]|nr:HYR domain-containing protein [Candidatus Eisenbacteria bacterium]
MTPERANAQTVATDFADYSPGDTVLVTGSGFMPNETVSLHFDETPYQFVLITLYTVADSEGRIWNRDYEIQDYHLGTAFVLTATGLTSGLTAQTFFTDNPKVGSVSVGSQSGDLCAGASASATFPVTVFRGNLNGSAGAFTANLTVPQGLPAGVTASFSPNPVSFTPGAPSRTSTLTLTSSAGTPAGAGTFRVKAATSASDTASTSATVTVNAPPSIAPPGNLTASNTPGQCGAQVAFSAAATGTPTPSVSYSHAPGSFFPVGTTTVTATATNACGSASTTFTVTVNDTEAPAITTSNLTRTNDPGTCAAMLMLDLCTFATDNCGQATVLGTRSDGMALGDAFPVGTTTVTWVATDTAGNSSTATQTVTVTDTQKPVLTAPADLTITTGADATQCGATIDDTALGTATATDNCGFTLTRDGIPAGHFFPVGTTTITWTATDPSGNTATATQLVTVADTTPPAITTAALDVPTGEGLCTATIGSLGTTAADHCGGTTLTGTRSDGAPLGDPFPVGTTTITWVATDLAGNASSLTQTVKVSDVEIPTLALPAVAEQFTGPGAASCAALVSDEALGTPVAGDNCGATVTRTGVPEGNLFPVGTTTIAYTATDPSGNSVTATQTVTVTDDTPPALTVPADLTLETGANGSGCGLAMSNAALGTATASDNCSVTLDRTGVPEGNVFPLGTTTITYTATDASGNTTSATQKVTVVDTTPPSITTANLEASTDAGLCTASFADLVTGAADNCGSLTPAGTRSDGAALGDPFPKGTTTITWTATDAAGNTATASQTVTVTNATPQVTILTPASGAIYAAGSNISVSGLFTDNAGDLHTARWVCDALTTPATVNEATGAVSGQLCLTTAGVYRLRLEVQDQCENTGSADQVGGLEAMIVVYDPTAGFVTGGGWISSPAGSYAANPALTGKANFGFVSRYKKGQSTPSGETEFQFKAGNLNFHSTSYNWLVVAGSRAQFKGSGTINGTGDFGFMITATDGQISGGGGQDRFRIKITDKVTGQAVYDNQMGASDDASPVTALGGGAIAIHSSSGYLSAALLGGAADGASATAGAPTETALFQNSPNPFNPVTTVRFALREAARATVQVYGVRGELVRTVVDGHLPAGQHTVTWDGTTRSGGRAASGVYYAVLEAGSYRSTVRMVMVK